MPDSSLPKKRFLVAPLDWGLGHATRCIPVIRTLLDLGQEIVIAARGASAALLREEFPQLRIVPISNYNIRYAASPLLLALKFPFMVARVFRCARREHDELRKLVDDNGIDAVISDQRFGCHSSKARSIYISHQLCVKMPRAFAALERMVWLQLRRAAEAFDELWIPDFAGDDNLTGYLTRKYPLPPHCRFVGPLCRFSARSSPDRRHGNGEQPDVLVILSGPEPQRTRLERIVLEQLKSFEGPATVALGKPRQSVPRSPADHVRIIPHVPNADMEKLVLTAGAIVARGGYTTIMELVCMQRKAVLIPTPGQTEQEYLCNRLAGRGRFVARTQRRFRLNEALDALAALPEPSLPPNDVNPLAFAVRKTISLLG